MAKKDYDSWTKEALIKELKNKKSYGLSWENQIEEAVAICKNQIPYIKELTDKAIENSNERASILIEGDNYHALSVLASIYSEKIDFIYIDPPYNTGARDWEYNNDFVAEDDSYRHSKWIQMMHDRLLIGKKLLKQDGIICVTIDDYEQPRLWLLLEEIFGHNNHLGTVTIRNNPSGRKSKIKIALQHEYAIFFGKSADSYIKKTPVPIENKSHSYKKDEKGFFEETNLRKPGVDNSYQKKDGTIHHRYYPIYFNEKTKQVSSENIGIEILPIDDKGERLIWRRGKEAIDDMYQEGELYVLKKRGKYGVYYKFRGGTNGEQPKSIFYDTKYSASDYGTKLLRAMLGKSTFKFPKALDAVTECITCGIGFGDESKNAVILDFFAGSGTTGHSILKLNNEDGGNRKFILCTNNENNICTEVTYPRLEKAINGYTDKNNQKEVDGLGGALRYFKVDFLPFQDTDANKKWFSEKSIEMICLKEEAHDLVEEGGDLNIYQNKDKYLLILMDELKIEEVKIKIKDLNKKIVIYIFSLSDEDYSEEFEALSQQITTYSFPVAIINTYKDLFQ